MIGLPLIPRDGPLSILCIGAHSDDIEIGAGATMLSLAAARPDADILWCVLSAPGARGDEAKASAADFLAGFANPAIELQTFRDGHFPYDGAQIKAWFEGLKSRIRPDIVFTHFREDAHQDHREACRLTWNSFRDSLILEYEIPKWDGDMGRPNLYVAADRERIERKVELLGRHFGTQRGKDWFDPETFIGLARLRGMECRAPGRYAEAFHARKILAGAAQPTISGA
jgi:LmbE family N-acetylglucosaminyl deacetylase